jgi:hypothetical protein
MEAYHQASLPLPFDYLFLKKISEDEMEYQKLIHMIPGSKIKVQLTPFIDQLGMGSIIIMENPNCQIASADGVDGLNAIIKVMPQFYAIDKHACCWVMKHEIHHIKNNDCLTKPLCGAVCNFAAALFISLNDSLPFAIGAASLALISMSFFSRQTEERADEFAIKHSSDEELIGGRRFLLSLKQANIKKRDFFNITSDGEGRWSFFHPTLKSRLKRVKKEIKLRGLSINHGAELEKIENLINLFMSLF